MAKKKAHSQMQWLAMLVVSLACLMFLFGREHYNSHGDIESLLKTQNERIDAIQKQNEGIQANLLRLENKQLEASLRGISSPVAPALAIAAAPVTPAAPALATPPPAVVMPDSTTAPTAATTPSPPTASAPPVDPAPSLSAFVSTDSQCSAPLRALNLNRAQTAFAALWKTGFVAADTADTSLLKVPEVDCASEVGSALVQLGKDSSVVFETGTSDGKRGSLCIVSGLEQTTGFMFAIEPNGIKWLQSETAFGTHRQHVKALLGTAVESTSFPTKAWLQTNKAYPPGNPSWESWFAMEQQLADLHPAPQLKQVCNRVVVDAVHLNSGVFSSIPELATALHYCKQLRYIFLRSIQLNKVPYNSLVADNNWAVHKEGSEWAIFKRVGDVPKPSQKLLDINTQLLAGALQYQGPFVPAAGISTDWNHPAKIPTGQVALGSPMGQQLNKIARRSTVHCMVELGTWSGGGSTVSIGEGLRAAGGFLFTVEAFEEMWFQAKWNTADYPVRTLLGSAAFPENMHTEASAIADGADRIFKEFQGPHGWREWLANERKGSFMYPGAQLREICHRYPVDAILLDAGEFAGYNEFRVALDECHQLQVVAMDDTGVMKNGKTRSIMLQNQSWRLVAEDMHDRHGYSIFEKK